MNITIKRAGAIQTTTEPKPKPSTDDSDVFVRKFRVVFADKRSRVDAEPIKEDDEVVDYKDVRIRGYLSTWKETSGKDRDGEWVLKGAFKSAIGRFMQNPVLLLDHRNSTDSIGGRFTKMIEDEKGLYVEAQIGNAPGLKDLRFNVAEGNLKTLSIGGAFRFDEDNRGIKEVELFEGSLTPVPSNPDARFEVTSLSARGKAFIAKGGALAGLKSIEDPFDTEDEVDDEEDKRKPKDEDERKSHPGAEESKEEFLPRCMSELANEYPEQDQRFAICNRYWEQGPKSSS